MDTPNAFSLLTLLLGLFLGNRLHADEAASDRRREFVRFARVWQWDIFRKSGHFTETRPEFIARARGVVRDVRRCRRSRFVGLVDFVERFEDYRLGTEKGRSDLAVTVENIIGNVDVA